MCVDSALSREGIAVGSCGTIGDGICGGVPASAGVYCTGLLANEDVEHEEDIILRGEWELECLHVGIGRHWQ